MENAPDTIMDCGLTSDKTASPNVVGDLEAACRIDTSEDSGERSHSASSSQTLGNVVRKLEQFVREYTPFCLVASYFIFSTSLYLICTPLLISLFWFIYLITNFYIAGSTVLEALMSIGPCRNARQTLKTIEANDWSFPTPDADVLTMDLLIVAYLPNEKDIIMDRIQYATQKIIYP